MSEISIPTFTRHYKYKNKVEESPFIIRYIIAGEIKANYQENQSNQQQQIIQKPILQPQSEVISQGISNNVKDKQKEQKYSRKDERKVEIDRTQYEQLKKYSKINMKEITIIEDTKEENQHQKEPPKEKRKKYKKADRNQYDQQAKNRKFDEEYESKGNYSNKKRTERISSKQKDNIYDEYVTLQQIQQSRGKGEKLYFRGRVQFGQGPKFRGRIISEQYEGVLLIQGKNKNRVIHDDKVYFSILQEQNEKIYCKIVHIIPSKRQIVGKVQFLHSKKIYILNPINPRISDINVNPSSIPKQLNKKLQTHYFIAEYLGWNIKSQFPECKIIQQFGKFGDIDVETTSLLKIHGVEDKEYDSEIVKVELKKYFDRIDVNSGEYIIPQEEIAKRQDLRKMSIVTIDPFNARDFDDALSITRIGDYFQVGVHIADASFFLDQGSQIDNQAKKRTTSVYLVHRVLPMLPRILCENLCSLNPGKERLTFTLWIKFDSQARIIEKPRISRSIIKSKARFTYEQAQSIIEGKVKSQAEIQQGFGCVNKDEFDNIANDIKLLHNISSELRKRRVERGSLFFQIPKKVFKLDENSHPVSFQIYERKEAHFLVEELMIAANEQVGEILVKELGPNALLRRHKYPGPKKILRFETFMNKINMPLKMSGEVRVQDQVNEVLQKKDTKQSVKDIVKYQMINLLQAADYFMTGDTPSISWIHYALNSPVYTHFTSPIRRYPDIIVHRLLASIIEGKKNVTKVSSELIQLCNQKKIQAKRVSNGCEKIFMCLYLRQNLVVTKGIIMDVEQWGIKICVPKYDFKGMLRFKQITKLSILQATIDPIGRSVLKIEYNGQTKMKFILKQMQEIQIKLKCKQGFPLDYQIILLMPCPKKPGQHLQII